MLTMRPPAPVFRSAGSAARVVSRSPMMLVSNIGLYSSGVASSIAPMKPKPALLTRTSSRPKASIANATAFSAAPALVTSSAVVRAVFGKALARSESVPGVARRGDDLVAPLERRLGEQPAEAGGTAGYKPCLGHDLSRELEGLENGTGISLAGLLKQAREPRKAPGRLIMTEAAGMTCLPRLHLNLLTAANVNVQTRRRAPKPSGRRITRR